MRKVRQLKPGKPSADFQWFDEILMLTQAAISVANTQRWALSWDLPPGVASQGRGAAYEVTVVDQFHQLGQRYFANRNETAVWECPFPTGGVGRPPAVDVVLYNNDGTIKTRLEFGIFTPKKLKDDAEKLHKMAARFLKENPKARNFVVLWHEERRKLSDVRIQTQVTQFADAATKAIAAIPGMGIALGLASGVDLFAAEKESHRVIYVAIFEVT